MQRNLLVAIVLSFVVLYGWQALFPPPPPQKPAGPAQQVTPEPSGKAAPPVQQALPPPPDVEAPKPLLADAAEQEIVVENIAVKATFTNKGGVLKSWKLKNYRDGLNEFLELVPQNIPNAARPFTLAFDDEAIAGALREALFKSDRTGVTVGSSPETLAFEFRDASGLVARKEFVFSPSQPYSVQFTATISRNGAPLHPTVLWGPALGTGVVSGGMIYAPAPQPIFYRDRDVTRVAIKNIDAHRREQGAFGFAGVDDHYFLSAVVPPASAPGAAAPAYQVTYDPVTLTSQDQAQTLQFISWSARASAPGERIDYFVGPKDLDVLQSIKPDLVRAIDFGMFDWLVVPLLRALKWLNGYIGNYGWSIIALTVLINLVLFPLRHKSVVSMRKMQEIQPQMKAIQDRYAKLKMNDPGRQKMNEEVWALYKQHGANPAAGCVPMLLMFPVLIAFYAMLSVAIELRGAPFVGWIRDLSIHDPFFVTPVLMGLTQFVQTKMTPMSGDPVQQKMMLFMPLMFAGMMFYMPSGLVIYWTASNIWTIGQQYFTNRLIGPPPAHHVRPAAERQLKTAGAGRSPQAAKERK
jgi:YidC/Oxa1 family membrane protein insertase